MATFGRGISYTPFFSEAMGDVTDALATRREAKLKEHTSQLASEAWAGDPESMQALAAQDPALAAKVESTIQQRAKADRQKTLDQAAQRETQLEERGRFQTEFETIVGDIAKFDSFEQAKAYAEPRLRSLQQAFPGQDLAEIMGPEGFDQNDFEDAKRISGGFGAEWEPVGSPFQIKDPTTGKPGTGVVMRNKNTGETRTDVVEGEGGASVERLSQYDPALAAAIARGKGEGKELGTTTEQRAQGMIDAGIKAADALPRVTQMLDLLDTTDTAGWKKVYGDLQQFFGFETADLSNEVELQQLAAEDVLAGLDAFTGAISEGEREYLVTLLGTMGSDAAANRRRLRRAHTMLNKARDRGMSAAEERGDLIGLSAMELVPYETPAQQQPPTVTSDADYDALPSGTMFIGPDGKRRTKP